VVFGPGQFWPSPNGWIRPDPFFLKKFKNPLKKIVIFSYIFLPILYDIGLDIYTVKYKSGIKIPGFLRNLSKKKFKTFSKKKKYFIAYGQILKFFFKHIFH